MSDESPLFLRLRTLAFSCVNFVSFLWVILYSIIIFSQWDLMGGPERALIVVMLIANVVTVITLLILLLLEFRIWLDIARILFLLIAQIGTAGAFAYWRPRFHCEQRLGDQQGICDVISFYILITSWIVPALLLSYLAGLAVRSYRHRPTQSNLTLDGENANPIPKGDLHSARPSLLPIMTNFTTPIPLTFPPEARRKPQHSVNTRRSAGSVYSKYSSPPATPHSANGSPGRLSKRSPLVDLV